MADLERPALSDISLSDARPMGWLRSTTFDQQFVVGTALLGIAAGVAATVRPELFLVLLFADLWFLGYHHVIATFTRLAFDRESFREFRFLVLGLPFLVLAATVGLWLVAGAWAITTVYFYWQWFHYTRQSYGVERIYWRSSKISGGDDRLTWYVIYGVPLWGMLARSAQGAESGLPFLRAEVLWLPVPVAVANVVGVVAVGVLAAWLFNRGRDLVRGELRTAHTLYVMSHVVIFFVGYIVLQSVDYGWLAVNVWHNAQYMGVVWMFNTNRFKNGIDPAAPFLSTISQPENVLRYLAVTLSLTTIVYMLLAGVTGALATQGVLVAVVIYQTVNFHHYIVDSVIWKLRKKKVSARLATA